MKKILSLTIVALLAVGLLAGCSSSSSSTNSSGTTSSSIASVADLAGQKVGVLSGTIADQLVLAKVPDASISYYPSIEEGVAALKSGQIAALCYDHAVLKAAAATDQDVAVLDEFVSTNDYALAVKQGNTELQKAINDTLAELKTNGTYDEMVARWMPESGAAGTMPEIALDGTNGTLTMGTAAIVAPFSYMDGKNFVGFDIELATRVAEKMGSKLNIVNMDFDKLISAVQAGDVDLIGGGIIVTDDRAQQVLFCDADYSGGIGVMVMK